MIRVRMFDGGTDFVVVPDKVPGMDYAAWGNVGYEEGVQWDNRTEQTNAGMLDTSQHAVRPWPLPWSNHMPFDNTGRHTPMAFRMDALDQYSHTFHPTPGGRAVFGYYPDITDRADSIISDGLDQGQVRDWVGDPTRWLHLPAREETSGTLLERPAWLTWQGLQGPAFRMVLEDNDLFTPFDLGEMGRYRVADNNTESTTRESQVIDFNIGNTYNVHLRPRLWQVYAKCNARYIYVDMVGFAYHDVVFIIESKMRAPVIPYRHNLENHKGVDVIEDWWGVPVSYDHGIDYAFRTSAAGRELSRQILIQQWHGWSSAYVLQSVSAATLTIYREVPRVGDVDLVIEAVDDTEVTDSLVLWQTANLNTVYPRTLIGLFYSDFFDPTAND